MCCEDLDKEKLEKLYEIYLDIEKKCGSNLVALINWMLFAKDWAEQNDARKEYDALIRCMNEEFERRKYGDIQEKI